MRVSIFGLFCCLCVASAFGNSKSVIKSDQPINYCESLVHSVWVTAGADYVASSIGDEIRDQITHGNTVSVNSSMPVSLRYSFSFTNPRIPHYLPGGYQGLSIGVLNLGGLQPHGYTRSIRNIGYPVLAYVFQGGPFHRFNDRLSLNYEWNFGASFGWKPYSNINENFNLTVGGKVNAYLNLGLMLNWRIDPHYTLFGGVAVSHFSNGNTVYPNPGINSFGLRVGMIYTLNPLDNGYKKAIPDTIKRRKVEYDVTLWGASRKRVYKGGKTPVLRPGNFASAGISFAPMVRLNSWWRVGGSLDLQWDQSSDMKANYISGTTTEDIKFRTPSFWRQVMVGIAAHGELRMPLFAVNIGLGYNVVAPEENKNFYQNITLKAYLTKFFFLNIGYQLRNFHQQSSLMLGVGATI